MKYFISCFGLSLSLIIVSVYINYKATKFENILHADAAGYYVWLPAAIIYRDADFKFTDTVFSRSEFYPHGFFNRALNPVAEAKTMNKYAPGAAISSLPFFLAAHCYGTITGENAGYEIHYQLSWLAASLFFVCLCLFYIFKIANYFNQPWYIPFSVATILVFGTNIFHYTTWDAGYSHAFTFGWSAMAAWFLIRSREGNTKFLIYSALCLGMIVVVRPFNLVYVPVWILSIFSPSLIKQLISKHYQYFIISILLFLMVSSLNLIGNYWQTGEAFIYSYGNEKFYFDKPHFWEFLFGVRVGIFVYSPLVLLLIVLSCWLLIRNRLYAQVIASVTGFFTIVWILSCWYEWAFGCTLGNRPMCDGYLLFAIPLLVYPLRFKKFLSGILTLLIVFGLYYNQVLHYQYRNWILDWCNRNWADFKDIFLETGNDYKFYMTEDWQFPAPEAGNIQMLNISKKGYDYMDKGRRLILEDKIQLDTMRQWRLKFTCNAKFDNNYGRRGSEMLVIQLFNNHGYYEYFQKFFKKKLITSGEWTPFVFEARIGPSAREVNAVFSIKNNDNSDLKIKDVNIQLIKF